MHFPHMQRDLALCEFERIPITKEIDLHLFRISLTINSDNRIIQLVFITKVARFLYGSE
jgi:hypothetical protein